jgi:hypothetical protein
MPDRRYRNQSRGEHAKQQIRELGQAARKAARQVDSSYPNTERGDRIVREFRQQANRIAHSGRQSSNRSLKRSSYHSGRSNQDSSGLMLGLTLLVLIVIVGLILIFLL